jgi:hypothetical protein
MAESTQVLLTVIGALLTVLTTLLLVQLTGIRGDMRSALAQLSDHKDDITKIKTVLRLNGCMSPDEEACARRKDDR